MQSRGDTELTAQQIGEITSQIVAARVQYEDKRARLKNANALLANPGAFESANAVLGSRLIQELKTLEIKLQTRLSELSTRYGSRHPTIVNIRAELLEVRGQLQGEIAKIAKALQNEVKIAEARVAGLEAGLSRLERKRGKEKRALIRLRELEREADANRMIFSTFLERLKETDQQEDLQEADARVISYAAVPRVPSYPPRRLVMVLMGFFGVMLGVFFVLVLEKLDNAFRSPSELEEHTGFACYAIVPNVRNFKSGSVADYISRRPASSLAEAVRNLRTVLNLRSNFGERGQYDLISAR